MGWLYQRKQQRGDATRLRAEGGVRPTVRYGHAEEGRGKQGKMFGSQPHQESKTQRRDWPGAGEGLSLVVQSQ